MNREQFEQLIGYLGSLVGEETTRGFTMGLATAHLHPEWAAPVYEAYCEYLSGARQASEKGSGAIVRQHPVAAGSEQ